MKRLVGVAVLVLSMSLVAAAQTLSQADRDSAMRYLESTKQGVLDATAGLSEAQAAVRTALAESFHRLSPGRKLYSRLLRANALSWR